MNNLLLEVEGPIAVLTINRPKALNALNSETLTELNEVLTEIEGRDDIKVVILTGAGEKSFVLTRRATSSNLLLQELTSLRWLTSLPQRDVLSV